MYCSDALQALGISYERPSLVVDQDKGSDGATPLKKRRRIAAPDTLPQSGCYKRCALQPHKALQKAWFAESK